MTDDSQMKPQRPLLSSKTLWDDRFRDFEEKARVAKTLIQMLIGIGLVLVLVTKALLRSSWLVALHPHGFARHVSAVLLHMPTLDIVGRGLAYSAGLDLAFMLFTPGPDEAIDPVIVGLAATILITISNQSTDQFDAIIPPIACLSIGFLLLLKRYFKPELASGHRNG